MVHAALARIKATPTPLAPSSAAISSSIATGGGFGSGFQFRLPDLFGVAASLLLATSILLALGRGSKLHSRDELCGANIRALGTAVESFASDHRREVPSSNWNVVPSLATVRQFVDDGYCPHQRVNCPCCRGEKEGDFFLLGSGGTRSIRVDRLDPRRPIVGDPNPLQVANMLGVPAPGPMSGPFLTWPLFSPAVGRLVRPLLPSTGLDQQGSGRWSGFHGGTPACPNSP